MNDSARNKYCSPGKLSIGYGNWMFGIRERKKEREREREGVEGRRKESGIDGALKQFFTVY